MRLLDNATPRQLLRWSYRSFVVSMPLCLLQMVAWATGVHPLPSTLALMIYLLFVAASCCSVVVATLASCHLAVSRAFGAGWRAGVEDGSPPPGQAEQALRAVE